MTGLVDAAFTRIRVVMTALVVMIIFGLAAFQSLPREGDPDVTIPIVGVTLPLPGISPEDGERLLIKPTELELQTLEGVKQVDSLAYDGAAQIIVEFETSVDMDNALIEVREAVNRAKAEYPADAEEPIISEFNAQNQFPILTIILSGDAPERALYQSARKLKDRLEAISGVLSADLAGDREELLEVIIDPEILESFGLTELEVVNAVTSNNRLVTAGSVDLVDGGFEVKVPGLIKNAADLMAIPVRVNGDRIVTVGDVGSVRRTFVDRTGYAIFNGKPSIGVTISKRAGANIVETIESAREATEDEAAFWPVTIQYSYLGDQSEFVSDSLSGLTGSVVTAVVLVMIVVVGALGFRSGVMVGIAIPTSFLIGFLLLSLFGFTLNMMVMFGLILSVGMLVDGAIVIIEFADRRMAEGADRKTAYMEASKRMFWPVITSTATTLAAFMPFLFWDDMVGDYMRFFPLTLIFVLSASLVVALIFLPVLGYVLRLPEWMKSRLGVRGKSEGPTGENLDEIDPTKIDGPTGVYARFLTAVIKRPFIALASAASVSAFCILTFNLAAPDVEYFIRGDNDQANILILARGNLSAEQEFKIAQEVLVRVQDHPAIESTYIQTGPGFSRSNGIPPETIGQVSIELIEYSKREHSRIVLEQLRDRVEGVPGVLLEVRQLENGPPIGKDLQVELSAASYDTMLQAAKQVREYAETAEITINGREVPVYMDLEDSMPLPGIEWSMDVDRTLAGRYGVSVQQAGAVLQLVTDGLLIDRYRPDDADDEIDIRARFPEAYRTIFALDKVRAQTPDGSVPLSNFVTRTAQPQIDRISRRDGRRILEIKANGNTRIAGYEVSQDRAITEMRNWLETDALGPNVSWDLLGADEETADAAAFFRNAMLASMFAIAMILLLEFNSFYHAFLTLTAVFLSVFGVLLGIALSGQYISVIMTGTGIVALVGIVVNNNIVLIDTYQHLRRKGLAVEDAVIRTAAQRARPVLLTTSTTILGLLPMVFELNVNFAAGTITHGSTVSNMWVLISSAIVYGLAFSTLLTLILTPVLLAAPTVIRKNFSKSDGDQKLLERVQETVNDHIDSSRQAAE